MKHNSSVVHLQGLYTVLVGLALTEAITTLIDSKTDPPIHFEFIPYFLAYLVTLVPIAHGALRHLDVAYLENSSETPRRGALMVDWSLLFVEGCGLLVLALFIRHPETFLYIFTGLLAFDALWAFIAYLAFSPDREKWTTEAKWAAINFVAAFFLVIVVIVLDAFSRHNPISLYRWAIVLLVAFGRTVWDYTWCWPHYFPGDPSSHPPQQKT